VVQLSVTNRCQCDCAHCGVKDINRPPFGRELTTAEVEKLLLEIKRAGFGIVDLYGGEPTLRADLTEIIRCGRALGLDMVLETNALKLDRTYLEALRAAGVGRIYVSLDDCAKERHDAGRGRPTFDRAVEALRLCRELGLNVHTSVVPRDRDFFLSGDINRYVSFCLEHGASGVRILFPCTVGSASARENIFASQEDELVLLGVLEAQYRDRVYVSSELATVNLIFAARATRCAAKSIFCHVSSAGQLMPCPYLPLVFADVTRESISEAFDRAQEHPLLRRGGLYCPSRDPEYISDALGGLSRERPFVSVASENLIDLTQACNNHCVDCRLPQVSRSKEEISREIAALDPGYRAVHVFGGEPFLRDDIYDLLELANRGRALHLHTNGRVFATATHARRLAAYSLASLRLPFFSFTEREFDAHTRVAGSFGQTAAGIRNLSALGVPVQVFTPSQVTESDLAFLRSLGVAAVFTYRRTPTAVPLVDTRLCFGRGITETSLVWRDHGMFAPIRTPDLRSPRERPNQEPKDASVNWVVRGSG
jgi:AdoMet-dependent heme synthase